MQNRVEKAEQAVKQGKLLPSAFENIKKWLLLDKYSTFRKELVALIENDSWDDLNDRFYQTIPFGTGGRRGPVGIGTNRMNEITIAEGAQGVADYFKKKVEGRTPRVVIAYDTRLTSREFALKAASVFCAAGFETYLFKGYRSTPELSFAVRYLSCDAGVVISASHNPPSDNGFKAYGTDGGQVVSPMDTEIIACVESVGDVNEMQLDVAICGERFKYIGEEVDEAYQKAVLRQSLSAERAVKIVYSPLHGAGTTSVLPVLKSAGFADIHPVVEQMTPDGRFPAVKNAIPNPEVLTALEKPIELGAKIGADIIIASDPDADRLAVAAPVDFKTREIKPLTGNQVGALLGWYALEYTKRRGTLTPEHTVFTTAVTSPMLSYIALDYNVSYVDDLLVGFKYVAEQIRELDDPSLFLFGTEESIGYMKGSYTRDKDAAAAALLACELAAELKKEGKTLWDGLFDLYKKYGYFASAGKSVYLEGISGVERMNAIMDSLRREAPKELAGFKVSRIIDRLHMTDTCIKTGEVAPYIAPGGHSNNLLIWWLDKDRRKTVAIRPSGTEPKIKFYYMLYADTGQAELAEVMKETDERIAALAKETEEMALKRA